MSNNDLTCNKCKAQHHPADDCGVEIIQCPDCELHCKARPEKAWPWVIYIHDCEHCGYLITESDWQAVGL